MKGQPALGMGKLNSFYRKAGGFLFIISMHTIFTMLFLILMECNQIMYEGFFLACAQVKFKDKSGRRLQFSATPNLILEASYYSTDSFALS